MKLRYSYLWLLNIFLHFYGNAQISVISPWSTSLNIDFGNGLTNPGSPFTQFYSDFTYTTNKCPAPGSYTISNTDACFGFIKNDAGHIFINSHPQQENSGYMMIANYGASSFSKTVFRDTIKNLCSNNSYLFWAGIRNLSNSKCFYPNFSFNVETLSGSLIQSFETGDIGGATDNAAPFFGYQAPDIKATFPYYYGGIFKLPSGINDVVLKILTNSSNVQTCTTTFAIDNILLTPVGPMLSIGMLNSEGYITSTCFQGNQPINLTSNISNGYYNFGNGYFIPSSFSNPAFQWQQSVDSGYTWVDIPGETNLTLSKVFNIPDTFFVRLRGSEDNNISNPNCSITSNIIQINVDGPLKDYNITSNSPVCEDSDIVLNLSGGATYITTGPNGFYDNSSYPHVYHPVLIDSGWYHSQIITQGGCFANDSTFVKVIGPNASASIFPDSICYGKTVQLSATGGKTYLWSPSTYLNNTNIANPISTPLATIKYQAQITDEFGCSAFHSVTVKVRDSILKAAFNSANVFCPNDVALFADSSIGKIKEWYWSFGNGQTSVQKNPPSPKYNNESNKIYPVQLIVTDSANCADTLIKFIKVVNNCYIAVPSAFTPNGDGLNDYLYPLNAYKATNLLFKVYNRLGKIMFETKDWTKKWDGKLNGISQPPGTYVWILTYTDASNQKIFLKGTTVLIR
ncbi:MAG TPA: gliding motility-associated C-terminal domain-containing protein [Parafilimonas sp.]|nr:gliding motility-associated C-terminal domain-containing protein [Parafilimonas sp.]